MSSWKSGLLSFLLFAKLFVNPHSSLCWVPTTMEEFLAPAVRQALLNGPAMTPPAGVIPNFDNPDTLSIYVIPTIVLAVVFATLALAMRLFTLRAVHKPLAGEGCE